MAVIFLSRGNATLGISKRDTSGEITQRSNATFTFDDNGPCVALGELNSDDMTVQEDTVLLYGAGDSAEYLGKILEIFSPIPRCNIPDFKGIFKAANRDCVDLCDYCQAFKCSDCIVKEWKDEMA